MKRKWRENEKMERKWRGNEEMEKDSLSTAQYSRDHHAVSCRINIVVSLFTVLLLLHKIWITPYIKPADLPKTFCSCFLGGSSGRRVQGKVGVPQI